MRIVLIFFSLCVSPAFGSSGVKLVVSCNAKIVCVNQTSFTHCIAYGMNSVLLDAHQNCPKGYVCGGTLTFPCVPQKKITRDDETTLPTTTGPTDIPCDTKGLNMVTNTASAALETTVMESTMNTIKVLPTESAADRSLEVEKITNVIEAESPEDLALTMKDAPISTSTTYFEPIKSTTTVPTSTTTERYKLTEAPRCNSKAVYPAAACNQYFECLGVRVFLKMKADLKTCSGGNHFNYEAMACIPASRSECKA